MEDLNLETIRKQERTLDEIETDLKTLTHSVDWETRRHVNYCLQKCLQLRGALWDVHRDLTGENREEKDEF